MTQRQTINPAGLFDSQQYGFSQAMVVEGGRRMLLSGQVGVDENENIVEGGIGPQMLKALDNIDHLLQQAGGNLSHVVMLRIYIAEAARDDQGPIAEALRRYFPTNPPPSSWIIVTGLSLPEWLIEIEAEAVLP
ncbi:RidA family protein [Mesorhizobium retamae]|uniref:RidA family protein n=1 Tax=Mesorhizobium retamae TaxID=2912854 RepID=A0ABS9QLV2_9HYPH|nr:RidA family protein [Mesorhizobium sp. IRAMC:0171]MCG7507569.1 RidA family protein [Mesorhizobium sp. IRAMC:0171]